MLPVICKTGRPFSPIKQHFILCDKETDYFFFMMVISASFCLSSIFILSCLQQFIKILYPPTLGFLMPYLVMVLVDECSTESRIYIYNLVYITQAGRC